MATPAIAQGTGGLNAQSTAAQTSDPVDQAVDSINDRLSTAWNDWAVTHSDVQSIANTLEGLDANQIRAVIDQLAADGTLDKVAQEFTDDKVLGLGGLTVAERSQFFNEMARKLDSGGLKTLSDAFAGTDANSGGYEDVVALGQAVATHASPHVQVEYVQEMASDMTDQPDYTTTHLGGSMSRTGDAEAAAVGEVLAGLQGRPSAAREAFGALSDEQMRAVMSASIDETVNYSSHAVSANLDGKVAGEILASASQINDPDVKARLFDAGAQTLEHINEDFGFPVTALGKEESANAVANGLTQLLDTDTTGIMRELAYNQSTMDGTSFGQYAKHMLNTGQEDVLGEQMARLQMGNQLNENPITRFEASVTLSSGAERHENAGTLGYFVGGVYSGAEAISSDVQQQQELTSKVLNSTLTVIGSVVPPAVNTGFGVAKDWAVYAIESAIEDPGTTAAQQLERAAIPTDPNTDEMAVGTAAFSGFNDRISQVTRLD